MRQKRNEAKLVKVQKLLETRVLISAVYLIVALAQMGSYLKLIEEKTMMKINPANYEGMLKDFPRYLSRRFVPDQTKKFIRNHGAITYC